MNAPDPPQRLWYVPLDSREPAYVGAPVVRFALSRKDFDRHGQPLTLILLEDGSQVVTAESIALLRQRAHDLLKYQGVDVFA